ncbi:hypothetical protein HJD18_02285 [Thermoleophilia bacterium SCSIO 60948]|nr:hypothetical protein HJD18_02285 [Thermoleophilia bacterium SCSIO 60948]
MILRVGGALALATILALAAVTGAQAKGKGPAKAAKLAVSMPPTTTAGQGVDIKLSALSKQGKPVRDFSGSLRATSSSSATTLPAKVKLTKGRATLRGVEFRRAGAVKVAFAGQIKGSARIGVEPGQLAELDLGAPSTAIVGQRFEVSAGGSDEFGNRVDAQPEFSISPSGSCDGSGCSAPRAGTYTVSADAAGVHAERAVEVSRGTVSSIELTAPSSVTAGQPFGPTARALDQNGNVLEDQTGEIALSFRGQACTGGSCSTTVAGRHTLTASVDGVSADRGIDVKPGAAKTISINSSNGFDLALPTPNGANADYSKFYPTPTSLTLSLTAADQYGNGVDTSGAELSGPGLSCSGVTCSATEAGRPTLTAKLGDATAEQPVRVRSLDETYAMSCRGENYDLNASVADGCEFAQPDPGHTTQAGAASLGRFTSCKDGESQFSFSGTHARDYRQHTGVEGFDTQYKGAPLIWKVQAGSGLCTNDVYLKFEGNSADRACLSITVKGSDGRTIGSKLLSNNGTVELDLGSGSYRDNETISFIVEASCWGSSTTNKTDFSVSGHL